MWEIEIFFIGIMLAWILYELYGRWATEYLSGWIRIIGGIVLLGFLYWQARTAPEEFSDSLDLAKTLLTHQTNSSNKTTERRKVSSLLKKRIAAGQQWRCGACQNLLDETYEVDHRLALFQGGTNDPDNLVALCPHCHRKKTVDERLI